MKNAKLWMTLVLLPLPALAADPAPAFDKTKFFKVCKTAKSLDAFVKAIPSLKSAREEISAVIDTQRVDYANSWLEDHGIQERDCPIWSKLYAESEMHQEFDAPDGKHYKLSWKPTKNGSNSTREITLNDQAFRFSSERVLDLDQLVEWGDFNFDGMMDLRLRCKPWFAQSRRFDIILLKNKYGQFEYSRVLSELDSFTVEPANRTIHSRQVIGNGPSKTLIWRWQNGRLGKAQ